MSTLSPRKRSELLSQYADGMIADKDRTIVEELLASDPSAKQELSELLRLKSLLGGARRLEPNIGFWTRLSMRLEDERQEAQNLLPFPKRYIPHVATTVTLVVAVFGFFAISNRMPIMAFFSKQSQAVLPLFANVDKDQALQFSLFGELPLDDSTQTTLRVDESTDSGYRIEVGKQTRRQVRPVTFDRFVDEVRPTVDQRRVIDSLLALAQERIAGSVLVGSDDAFAVDPELPHLNRIIVTGIASCLEPPQRRRFERLLAVHEAPYAVSMEAKAPAVEPSQVFSKLRRHRPDQFMVITPDTAVVARVRLDLDSLRRLMEFDIQRMESRRRVLFERIEAGEFRWSSRPPTTLSADSMAFFPEGDFIRVEVGRSAEELPAEFRVMVTPRTRERSSGGSVHIQVFAPSPPAPRVREVPPILPGRDSTR
jgi:hypothetical protein